jgi:integrase
MATRTLSVRWLCGQGENMSLYRRPDSKYWWAAITCPDGGTVRLSTKTADRKAAEAWCAQTQHEAWQQQRLGVKPKYLWDEAVVKWCEETMHKVSHQDDLAKFRWLNPYLGGVVLNDISREQIAQIAEIKAQEASCSTANRYLALIRAVCRRAVHEWEWIDKVPKVRLYPEPKRRIRFLTIEEVDALLKRLPDHQRSLTMFALATGLRQANVLRLQWNQVNLTQRLAWIHADQAKAREAIAVPLNELAMSVLNRQRGRHDQCVFTYKGRPVSQANTRVWRKALADLGIENFRWHDLRHTWASWLAMNGATLSELQELGGWKSASMVRRYAHLSANHLMKVSSKLDGLIDKNLSEAFTFSSRVPQTVENRNRASLMESWLPDQGSNLGPAD